MAALTGSLVELPAARIIGLQGLGILVSILILVLVLDLVRRRRLAERYALLWMLATVVLLLLAIGGDSLLQLGADALGFADPVNALFLVAFLVVFILLLHFSVATSRLSEEAKILAQEVARLDAELRMHGYPNGSGPDASGGRSVAAAEHDEDGAPVRAQQEPEQA